MYSSYLVPASHILCVYLPLYSKISHIVSVSPVFVFLTILF